MIEIKEEINPLFNTAQGVQFTVVFRFVQPESPIYTPIPVERIDMLWRSLSRDEKERSGIDVIANRIYIAKTVGATSRATKDIVYTGYYKKQDEVIYREVLVNMVAAIMTDIELQYIGTIYFEDIESLEVNIDRG